LVSERGEAIVRIFIGIVSGILLHIWEIVVAILAIFHWIYVILTGERHAGLAKFSNQYCTQDYKFNRYMTFVTNERPFPFNGTGKDVLPVSIKKK
jgi:hypothetical protein